MSYVPPEVLEAERQQWLSDMREIRRLINELETKVPQPGYGTQVYRGCVALKSVLRMMSSQVSKDSLSSRRSD